MEDVAEEQPRTVGNRAYAVFIAIFASFGGVYFGYDQGVTGGMLTMRSFIGDFCVDDDELNCSTEGTNLPTRFNLFITLYNVIYYFGCLIGALVGGLVAERKGRRAAVFFAALTFNVGTWWVITTPAGRNGSALAGRVLEGVGVGSISFAAPLYSAEVAPREFRGALAGLTQMAVVTGLFAANAVNLGTADLDNGWRVSNGVITVPPVIMMIFIFCLPESPRFVFQTEGEDNARAALRRVRKSDDIEVELRAIREQVELEEGNKATYADCFKPDVRKRTFIAISLQLLQQASGINPVFTYGGLIFAAITENQFINLFVLSGVNFVSTIPALYWIDRYGRRTLMLIGAVGMFVAHIATGTLIVAGCDGDENEIECANGVGTSVVAMCALFIFFFAVCWGPLPWVYQTEIFPVHVRARAVSLATASNWFMGGLSVAINQLFPYLTIAGVFYLFSFFCLLAFWYVRKNCPETKGMILEDIEVLFNPNARKAEDLMDEKEIQAKPEAKDVKAAAAAGGPAAEVAVKEV